MANTAPPTFTISAEGGLVRSTGLSRSTLATLNATSPELKQDSKETLRIATGSNVDLSFSQIQTARLLLIQPSILSSFGEESSNGVSIIMNGASPGTVYKGRAFILVYGAVITSINIANNSGSEIAVEIIRAG